MKKYLFSSVAILFVLFLFVLFLLLFPNMFGLSVKKSFFESHIYGTDNVTCTYPQMLQNRFYQNEIVHEFPKEEKNPMIFTFSDLDKDVAKLKFIDATRDISEVPILKVSDTDEKAIFVEGSGDPYITVHTIYKNKGVAIFSKQTSLMDIPVGTLSMGSCVNF